MVGSQALLVGILEVGLLAGSLGSSVLGRKFWSGALVVKGGRRYPRSITGQPGLCANSRPLSRGLGTRVEVSLSLSGG